MKNRKGQESNLGFVGKLIIAALSLIIIVFVGMTFASIFVPVKLDVSQRMDIISSSLNQEIADGEMNYAFFDINKNEFMVLYMKDYSQCGLTGEESWPLLTDTEVGFCMGKKDSVSRSTESLCSKIDLQNILGDSEELDEIRLGTNNDIKGIKHRAEALGVKEGVCIEHNDNVKSYRVEILRRDYIERGENKQLIRIDIY